MQTNCTFRKPFLILFKYTPMACVLDIFENLGVRGRVDYVYCLVF